MKFFRWLNLIIIMTFLSACGSGGNGLLHQGDALMKATQTTKGRRSPISPVVPFRVTGSVPENLSAGVREPAGFSVKPPPIRPLAFSGPELR